MSNLTTLRDRVNRIPQHKLILEYVYDSIVASKLPVPDKWRIMRIKYQEGTSAVTEVVYRTTTTGVPSSVTFDYLTKRYSVRSADLPELLKIKNQLEAVVAETWESL